MNLTGPTNVLYYSIPDYTTLIPATIDTLTTATLRDLYGMGEEACHCCMPHWALSAAIAGSRDDERPVFLSGSLFNTALQRRPLPRSSFFINHATTLLN